MGQGITVGFRAVVAALALGVGAVSVATGEARAQDAASTASVTAPAAKTTAAKASAKARHKPSKTVASTKPTAARAAPSAESTGPAQSILGALHLAAPDSDMPDFVRETRPQQLDYLPITSRGAEPDSPILTPDEIRRREADLEKLRSRHDRIAARAPAPAVKSAAPEPVAKKTKVAAPCLLTCTIKTRPDSMKQ